MYIPPTLATDPATRMRTVQEMPAAEDKKAQATLADTTNRLKIDYFEMSMEFRQTRRTIRPPEDGDMRGKYLDIYRSGFFNARDEWTNNGFDGITENIYNAQNGEREERAMALLKELIPLRNSISSAIKSALKNSGLGSVDANKLKIEIGSNGKIMVGGIKDKKKLQEIQEALNKTSGLAGQIKDYQNKEKLLKADVADIERIDPDGGKRGVELIEEIVRNGEFDENGFTTATFERPLYYAIAELYRDDGPDFSSTSKGVADPVGTLDKEFSRAKQKITEQFQMENDRAKAAAEKSGKPESADVISMQNVKIIISPEGQIIFEGRFAKSDAANSAAEAMARMVLEDEMNKDSEGADRISTAMLSLEMQHDEAFGKSDGKKAEIQISDSGVSSYITDPAGIEKAKGDIRQNAASFLSSQLGAAFSEKDFSVNEKGVISLTSVPKGASREQADKLIAEINKSIADSGDPAAAPGGPTGPEVDRIAKGVKQMKSYGPEGDRSYTYAAYDAKKEAEDNEAIRGEALRFRAEYKYTYSDPMFDVPDKYIGKIFDKTKRSADDFAPDSLGNYLLQRNAKEEEQFQAWLNGKGEYYESFSRRFTEDGYSYYRTDHMRAPVVKNDSKASDVEINGEQFLKYDGTQLTRNGFSTEEREDFLNTVQGLIDDLGYDISAKQLSYGALSSQKNPHLTELYVQHINGTDPTVDSTTFGMNKGHQYTGEQYSEFIWQLGQAMNRSSTLSDKGYIQQMRNVYDDSFIKTPGN